MMPGSLRRSRTGVGPSPQRSLLTHSVRHVRLPVSGMSGRPQRRGHSVETELVALDVLHHDAGLVFVIGRQ